MINWQRATIELHAATLARPTSIVWDGRHIFDNFYGHASSLKSRDGTFAPRSRSFDADIDFADPEFGRFFCRLLSRNLTGKRRALSTALKSTCAGTCPAQGVTLGIGDGDGGVIKGGANVRHGHRYISTLLTTLGLCHSL